MVRVNSKCEVCSKKLKIDKNENSRKDLINFNALKICKKCIDEIFPFSELTDNEFQLLNKYGISCFADEDSQINLLSPTQTAHLKSINEIIRKSSTEDDEEDVVPSLNCNYFNIEEFLKLKIKESTSFSIFHLNIHSIQKHIEELRIMLSMLELNFDAIAITESKLLKDTEPIVDISIDGYHYPIGTNTEATKGGVLLYIKDSLNFKPRTDLMMYSAKKLESVFVEIINPSSANTIIGSIYRHPSMSGDDFNELKLRPLIQKLSKHSKKYIFIAGDYNFDLLNTSSHRETSDFFDIMTTNYLLPSIIIPTKINRAKNTLIDNVFTNQINPDMISGNLSTTISDHLPSFVIIPKSNQRYLPKKHNILRRDTKHFDRENFLLDLLGINWDEKISYTDADSAFDEFYLILENLLDKYLPLKKITQKQYKRRFKPWITKGILKSCEQRDKMHHQYTKSTDPSIKSKLFAEYKIVRNEIVNLIRISKVNHYHMYFSKHNTDLRKIWIGIKQIINVKSKTMESPTCIEENDTTISEPTQVATKFNDYFADIAKNIVDDRKYEGNSSYKDYWPPRPTMSLAFYRTDHDEIIQTISKFKSGKACGPTSIPIDILQLIKFEIATPLARIVNLSLETGSHPEKLKIAKVIPIYKKGSKMSTSNYRPISLLSNINKIFEKIVFDRVYAFIEKNKMIYTHQYGFRKSHSTTHALISITEQIRKALDNKDFAVGVFVDFQKAFDTVDHNILLDKLNRYGITGKTNEWFRSYLRDRKQFVSILGFESNQRSLSHGVPQGSVLGPLLFLLYINDLHRAIKSSTVFHFADDTNLLLIGNSLTKIQKQMNSDLNQLYRWLLANKISLNVAKTELIIFRKTNEINPHIKIKLNGSRLYPSKSIKYLGIHLDCDLSGLTQCNEILPKLRRANGMLAKARHYISQQSDLISIYYSMFSSILLYASLVWGLLDNPTLGKIERAQKAAIRIISFSEFKAHTSPLFKELKILKFKDYIQLQHILLLHDHRNNKLPSSFKNFFSESNLDWVETRAESHALTKLEFTPMYNQIRYGRKSITNTSVSVWNRFAKHIFPDINMSALSRKNI